MLHCYEEAVNYLLATDTDESIISLTDAAINELHQRESQSPITFKGIVFAKSMRCGRVYRQDGILK